MVLGVSLAHTQLAAPHAMDTAVWSQGGDCVPAGALSRDGSPGGSGPSVRRKRRRAVPCGLVCVRRVLMGTWDRKYREARL